MKNFKIGQHVQYISVDGRECVVEVLTEPVKVYPGSPNHHETYFHGRVIESLHSPESIGVTDRFATWNFHPMFTLTPVVPDVPLKDCAIGDILRKEFHTESGMLHYTVLVRWVFKDDNPNHREFHGRILESTVTQVAREGEMAYFTFENFTKV